MNDTIQLNHTINLLQNNRTVRVSTFEVFADKNPIRLKQVIENSLKQFPTLMRLIIHAKQGKKPFADIFDLGAPVCHHCLLSALASKHLVPFSVALLPHTSEGVFDIYSFTNSCDKTLGFETIPLPAKLKTLELCNTLNNLTSRTQPIVTARIKLC